jgi:tRNA G18 (ribose-2'-O)-methylase SpoU
MTDVDNPSPEQTTWGVGPHAKPWPTGEQFDPELLENGDTRNVLDQYRYWKMEAIVAELDSRRHSFHVAIENWQHDLNIGSIVRTANAFLAAEVHIIGNRRWNRRGAMVTDRYQHVRHHPTVEDFLTWTKANKLPIIAIDNVPGCKKIEQYDLPESCVLLFGQEGPGLSEEAIKASKVVLEISQFGSTRSINASAAAAIAMHSWITTHVF